MGSHKEKVHGKTLAKLHEKKIIAKLNLLTLN